MSDSNADCPNCRVLRFALRSREGEIDALRRTLARMDEQPSGDLAEWTIRGEDPSTRLTLAGPVRDESGGAYYRVTVEERSLRASADVYGIEAAGWVVALDDLEPVVGAWEGQKSVGSVEGDFIVTWEYQNHYPVPLVDWHVRLGNDWNDPRWTIDLRLEVRIDAMAEILSRARAFFSESQPTFDQGADVEPR